MSNQDFGIQFELGPDDVRLEMDSSVYYVRIVERGESLRGVGVSGLESLVLAAVVALGALLARPLRRGGRAPRTRWTVGVVRLDRTGAGSVRVLHREKVVGRADALRRASERVEDVRAGVLR